MGSPSISCEWSPPGYSYCLGAGLVLRVEEPDPQPSSFDILRCPSFPMQGDTMRKIFSLASVVAPAYRTDLLQSNPIRSTEVPSCFTSSSPSIRSFICISAPRMTLPCRGVSGVPIPLSGCVLSEENDAQTALGERGGALRSFRLPLCWEDGGWEVIRSH